MVGFFGASSMERLPTGVAMTENMKRFKFHPHPGESMSLTPIARAPLR